MNTYVPFKVSSVFCSCELVRMYSRDIRKSIAAGWKRLCNRLRTSIFELKTIGVWGLQPGLILVRIVLIVLHRSR